MEMIRLLVVDDQPVVRVGLRMRLALEPDIDVVGEAEDGAAALEQAGRLHPNVVLMDIEMPRMDGLAATAALREAAPESAVVILSLYDSAALRAQARLAGAAGFVAKHEADAALLEVIRSAGAPDRSL
jgi:DNA-binding NarL/FixJ family response regulator